MIITNREEVIDKAFGVFVRMNYEKASIITLAKATNRKTSLPLLPIRWRSSSGNTWRR